MAQLLFPDSPTVGDVYAGDNGVNYTYTLVNGLYVWLASPAAPLTVTSAGTISGTAAAGSVLTYTQGSATGGTSPYTYTWQWKKASDDSLLQTGLTTYTIPSTLIGDRVYVALTATDASSATATGDTTDYPASPSTISAATFPNSVFSPAGAPNASPASVSVVGPPALNGTGTCASWADGATSLTSTGGIWFSVAGGAYGTGSTAVNPGNSVSVIWNPATVAAAADGVTLTGTLTNGTYTNTYTLVVDRAPDASSFLFTDLDPEPQSTAKTSNTVTPAGFTVPITLTVAGAATNPLTAIGASVGGAAFSSASQTVNPGQTVQLRGTTGAAVTTTYGMTATLGAGPSISDTWTVKTASAAATVAQPSVLTPSNNATGVGTATGLTLTSGTYTASNGAGLQDKSEWEVYANGLPNTVQSTNTISAVAAAVPTVGSSFGGGYFAGQISTAGNGVADYNLVVAPVTSGSLNGQYGGATPTGVQWRNSLSADTNPPSQNSIYGKLATDAFDDASHPLFDWCNNSSTGPNAGASSGGTGIGGYNDWYIPAQNELEILYYNLKPRSPAFQLNNTSSGVNSYSVPIRSGPYTAGGPPNQTSSSVFQFGNAQAFALLTSYWSSTQYSVSTSNAWRQSFDDGNQTDNGKTAGNYARAIRRVAVTGIGSTQTLSITAANTDGFTVGMAIKGSSSSATGIITAIDGTSVTITQTSATNWTTSDKIQGNGTALTGSPFTVNTGTLTSLDIAKPPLVANTPYYARVRYTSQTVVTTSDWSGWSKFTTGSLMPIPGDLFGGGYFAGQINDGGTIYNLIVAPVRGDVTGPNSAGTLQGQNQGAQAIGYWYKLPADADFPSATVQNQVYGGTITNLFDAANDHPAFSDFINGATGPNAGSFNLASGGSGTGTGIGGYNDWYLPAKNELEILYYNLKPDATTSNNASSGINPNAVPARASNYTTGNPAQTANTLFQVGGAQALAGRYWSSSEVSGGTGDAVHNQQFSGATPGGQSQSPKNTFLNTRAIRRVAA